MGCDIHIIIEIKENNQWKFIDDLPEIFTSRGYGFFSILNRNVRNYCGVNGFESKGKPNDCSVSKAHFCSSREELESQYNRKATFCRFKNQKGEYEYLSVFDERLRCTIPLDLCQHLKDTGEQSHKYLYPNPNKTTDNVYDASLVGGEFVSVPYSEVFPTLKEFNFEYYKIPWCEEKQDFGYYEFDLDRKDCHSHSYLDLKELKSKYYDFSKNKKFLVNREFLEILSDKIDLSDSSEFLAYGEVIGDDIEVTFLEDTETCLYWKRYNQSVDKLIEIKEKYSIKNDEDIRIVFCFDT